MNTTKSLVIITAIVAALAIVGAAGIAAELEQLVYASTSNNQQNQQFAFNFNNQQFKSNFQCFAGIAACSP